MTEEEKKVEAYWKRQKELYDGWYSRGQAQMPGPKYKIINARLHEEIYVLTKLLHEIKYDMLNFTDGYVIINKIDEVMGKK